MGKDKRGFFQSLLDDMGKEDVKFGPKGKPRQKMDERQARKKSEREAWMALADEEE